MYISDMCLTCIYALMGKTIPSRPCTCGPLRS